MTLTLKICGSSHLDYMHDCKRRSTTYKVTHIHHESTLVAALCRVENQMKKVPLSSNRLVECYQYPSGFCTTCIPSFRQRSLAVPRIYKPFPAFVGFTGLTSQTKSPLNLVKVSIK